ncbi:MAG: hypothetical protein M1833_003744 [Piccolia ochrophora]|nr:MAG: hypothetical protein M1833_003744 [Piccolia ochrophora]
MLASKPPQDDVSLGPPTPRRRSSESSTAGSAYDRSGLSDMEKAPMAGKVFDLFHTSFHLNLILHSDHHGGPAFYIDNSAFTKGKPDVTMHSGSTKDGPIVGVCKFTTFSSNIKAGLGDPAGNDVIWEAIDKESKDHSTYRLEITMTDDTRRAFIWKRTHDVKEVGGHSWSMYNKKLIDESTGETVALYLENGFKNWSKKGKISIGKDHGRQWELTVLLTLVGLIEKDRRRSRARRIFASGGGGGDGGGGG